MKRPAAAGSQTQDTSGLSAVTEAFSTTCAGHVEDCDGWCLSGCRGRAMVAQARSVLGLTPSSRQPFDFPLFSPHNTSKFQHKANACFEQV